MTVCQRLAPPRLAAAFLDSTSRVEQHGCPVAQKGCRLQTIAIEDVQLPIG